MTIVFGLTLNKYYGTKDNEINTWEKQVRHWSNDSTHDILITGIQNEFSKCYTQPLLFPSKIRCGSPLVTISTSIDTALEDDEEFWKDNDIAVACKIRKHEEYQLHLVKLERTRIMNVGKEYRELLFVFDKLPHWVYIQAKTPMDKIQSETNW